MNLLSYFNLNKGHDGPPTFGSIITVDYKAKARPSAPPLPKQPPETPARPMPLWEQGLLYAGVIIGVLFSSTIAQFQKGMVALPTLGLGTVLVAAVVALIIIPVVFDKLKVSPGAPLIMRFGLFVQHGAFWHIILTAIGKTIG